MARPLRTPFPTLAAALGVVLGSALSTGAEALASGRLRGAAFLLGLALVVLARVWAGRLGSGPAIDAVARGRLGMSVTIGLAAGLLAWAAVHQRTDERLRDWLDPALEGRVVHAVVDIDDMPGLREQGVRLRVAPRPAGDPAGLGGSTCPPGLDAATDSHTALPARIQLLWPSDRTRSTVPAFQVGERWCLPMRLKRPHGEINPVGFDAELWLFEQGIGATGSVPAAMTGDARRVGAAQGRWLERARQAVRDRLVGTLGDRPATGLLAALVVGEQSAIERADWALFRRTGVAHLVAISGLHVTMFAWVAGAVLRAAWRHWPAGMRWQPAGRVARLGGWLAAAAYAGLAGWGVPAQRTAWMLGVWVGLDLWGGRWGWARVLGAAALVVVAIDPWALWQPGFWLSFCAVGLLMAQGTEPDAAHTGPKPGGAGPVARAGAWAARAVRLQGLVSLALAPLSLLFFQQVSVIGLLANLVAIPWVTLVVTPLALLGALWSPLWSVAAGAAEVGLAGLAVLGAWPLAQWQSAQAPVWLGALGLVGALWLATPGPRGWRVMGVPLVLALALPPVPRPAEGQLELWGFDVGQGNAVLLRTRSKALLYDSGPRYWPSGDAGERVLLPQLHALGVGALDLLVLSHRDSDHIGGAAAVLQDLPVRRITSSLEPGHPLRARVPHQPCVAGQRWRWDGVDFEVLHPDADLLAAGALAHLPSFGRSTGPDPGDPAAASPRPNALSCVLSVRAGTREVLLTGDIEGPQELRLVDQLASRDPAEVVMVPHHGSRTSSMTSFVGALRARWALIQAGYLNRYGHPAAEVEARWRASGARVVRTDRCGAWHWRSEDGQTDCLRHQRRRLWHTPMPE